MPQVDVLQMCSFSTLLNDELQARFRVHRWFTLQESEQEQILRERSGGIRAVVTGGQLGLSASLMARLPSLGIVAINGVGFDKVDLVESKRRGIRVTTTPGVLTDDVADLAVGLIISLLRGIPASDRFLREGQWTSGERPLAHKVTGRRFGIVGLGHIGRAIAHRLSPFGPVAYCDVKQQPVSYAFVPSPIELARQSDVLVLATTANASTQSMVSRPLLDALGPQGYLINVARGALVDEPELIKALGEKGIAGAALDVFADEPRVPEALRNAPNVVVTPHIASATVETREAMARAVLENLDAYFAGKSLPGAIA
jgi:lactate dehydrogenase-like 2-hydroxyacid dehydrogenase